MAPMPTLDLDATAALAADPDRPTSTRVRALISVVERVSLDAGALPEAIADALDDVVLVDAVVAARRADVVCAALHRLGARSDLASTRRRVVRRLVAAGASGLALAGLAVAIGDRDAGVQLAVRDFSEHIVARARSLAPDPMVRAWLAWLAKLDETASRAVIRTLRARDLTLAAALEHATDVDAALIASRSV
jgi:hypothetical protein